MAVVNVDLTDPEIKAIGLLLRNGLYGRTQADVVERLVARALQELVECEILDFDDFIKDSWKD